MIDSHAHIISEFYEYIDELVKKTQKQGIVSVINCGDSLGTSKEVIEICKKYHDILFPVVGIHPDNISDKENMISKLENIIISNKVYGIGEIGLDYYHNNENRTEQKELFSDQIDLANKYNLPIVVHTRDSIQDCFDILKRKVLILIHSSDLNILVEIKSTIVFLISVSSFKYERISRICLIINTSFVFSANCLSIYSAE